MPPYRKLSQRRQILFSECRVLVCPPSTVRQDPGYLQQGSSAPRCRVKIDCRLYDGWGGRVWTGSMTGSPASVAPTKLASHDPRFITKQIIMCSGAKVDDGRLARIANGIVESRDGWRCQPSSHDVEMEGGAENGRRGFKNRVFITALVKPQSSCKYELISSFIFESTNVFVKFSSALAVSHACVTWSY